MGFTLVSYGFGIWLFCVGYFPIQKVTKWHKPFIYKALRKYNTFKVQIRYNTFQEIHF